MTGEVTVIRYFAHSANKVGGAWEPLREHLRSENVRNRVRRCDTCNRRRVQGEGEVGQRGLRESGKRGGSSGDRPRAEVRAMHGGDDSARLCRVVLTTQRCFNPQLALTYRVYSASVVEERGILTFTRCVVTTIAEVRMDHDYRSLSGANRLSTSDMQCFDPPACASAGCCPHPWLRGLLCGSSCVQSHSEAVPPGKQAHPCPCELRRGYSDGRSRWVRFQAVPRPPMTRL